jgi:nucleotide-binding universal stress UspA family protein
MMFFSVRHAHADGKTLWLHILQLYEKADADLLIAGQRGRQGLSAAADLASLFVLNININGPSSGQ